ncbi:trypsin-like peptidase domain-containing protein [Mesobacterium sp. TK19101]|uniref:Trypsin-like peptidase domain-containing protein n=1 Tax=Mesobacterium hydrothermale TaxID=3111907 RepID=A0ABU6HLB7_9RHOB|nr:trypsin-like peptidase domain-containing protein [Mesobacterium sp. TK19101]MEC3863156.1 trypsin-like peptidase domain-containing protein [Mesobacterium sp. TK19101]
MRIAEARARTILVRKALADHPDVTAVGVGEKYTGGQCQKYFAARIMVERKGAPHGAPLPPVFHTSAGPIPTDIVEASAQAFATINSVLDGADIVIEGTKRRSGTLAFVTVTPHGAFGITNAHVVTAPNGDARGRSVFVDIAGKRTQIGSVAGHSPYRDDIINRHDVALIRLDPGGKALALPFTIEAFAGQRIRTIGRLSAAPQAASRFRYTYASKAKGALRRVELSQVTELTQGILIKDRPSGRTLHFSRVFQLSVLSGAVRPGHSGAALVRALTPTDLVAVGILFAGDGNIAFALSWSDIEGALATFGA